MRGIQICSGQAKVNSSLCLHSTAREGEMECHLGEFGASTHSLNRALEVCPTYDRAREVSDSFLLAISRKNMKRPMCLVHIDQQNAPRCRWMLGSYLDMNCPDNEESEGEFSSELT